jgi:hypothetical protein
MKAERDPANATTEPRRLEAVLHGFFLACWLVFFANLSGLLPLRGALPLSLYTIFGAAATVGWLAGNFYVHRSRGLPPAARLRTFLLYFFDPPALFLLLWGLTPVSHKAEAPLVPLYAVGVFTVFFLVPVSLRPRPPRPPGR